MFLTLLTSGVQYLVQTLNYKKDLERIETFVRQARLAAWGPKMLPLEGARKVRVSRNAAEAESGGDGGGGARSLEMLVEGDAVYLVRFFCFGLAMTNPPSITVGRRGTYIA